MKLKPCPLCGAISNQPQKVQDYANRPSNMKYAVYAACSCFSSGPEDLFFIWGASKQLAALRWNSKMRYVKDAAAFLEKERIVMEKEK